MSKETAGRRILAGLDDALRYSRGGRIPDELFRRVERVARERGVSRSELYARALEAFLEWDEDVTRRLNEVYANEPLELEPGLARCSAGVDCRGRVVAEDGEAGLRRGDIWWVDPAAGTPSISSTGPTAPLRPQ